MLTHTQGRQQQLGILRIEKIQVFRVNAVVVDGFLVVPIELQTKANDWDIGFYLTS